MLGLVLGGLGVSQGCFDSSLHSLADGFVEKAMAPHSSIFTWEIPWTEEFGGL